MEANRWKSRRMFEEENKRDRVEWLFVVYVTVKRGKEEKSHKNSEKE